MADNCRLNPRSSSFSEDKDPRDTTEPNLYFMNSVYFFSMQMELFRSAISSLKVSILSSAYLSSSSLLSSISSKSFSKLSFNTFIDWRSPYNFSISSSSSPFLISAEVYLVLYSLVYLSLVSRDLCNSLISSFCLLIVLSIRSWLF